VKQALICDGFAFDPFSFPRLARSELRQIVDPDGLLKTSNAVCHFFKAAFAKELMFSLLEILCHCVVLMSRHETSQQRVRIRECQHRKSFRPISEAQFVVRTTLPTDPDGQPVALGVGRS
jgi:hypothetical protein